MATMARRLMSDLKEIMTQTFEDSPPVYVFEERTTSAPVVLALVIGPPGTPYAHGFFLFRIQLGPQYPNTFPSVRFLTTDNGTVRLNPNLYNTGKVCLSILGTWAGESGESWRSTYSLLYVLRCLQSMVLTSEPFFNEPGTERFRRSPRWLEASREYTHKIFHESMRVAQLQVLESLLGLPPPDSTPWCSMQREADQDELTAVVAASADLAIGIGSPTTAETPGLSEAAVDDDAMRASAGGTPVTPLAFNAASPLTYDEAQPPQSLHHHAVSPAPAAEPIDAPHDDGEKSVWVRVPSIMKPSHSPYAPFAPVIKRYAYLWLETLKDSLVQPSVLALDGQRLPIPMFELRQQQPPVHQGAGFEHANLHERLCNVESALDAETETWRQQGIEHTANAHAHILASRFLEEFRAFCVPCINATIPNDANVFVWHFSILNPTATAVGGITAGGSSPLDSIYEQSMYTVEAVFCPTDEEEPPRVRFLQPIFHPNVSPKRGVPYHFFNEATVSLAHRYLPSTVARQLLDLLTSSPLPSATAAVNPEASQLCFSQSEVERKVFLRRARQMAERTLQ